jgi:type I restriction enzyme, S subunit
MPQDWYDVLFGDFCDITRGGSPRPINDYIAPVGIPWVKIADVSRSGTRFIDETNEFIRPEGEGKSRRVFPGDLILSNSATPGIPMFMGIEACIHDGWMLLRNLRGVDKLFCFYLLQHERANLLQQGNGSVFVNLKTLLSHKLSCKHHSLLRTRWLRFGWTDIDQLEQ